MPKEKVIKLSVNDHMSPQNQALLSALIQQCSIEGFEDKLRKADTKNNKNRYEYEVKTNTGDAVKVRLKQSLLLMPPDPETKNREVLVIGDFIGAGAFGKVKRIACSIEFNPETKNVVAINPSDRVNKSEKVKDSTDKAWVMKEAIMTNQARDLDTVVQQTVYNQQSKTTKVNSIMPELTGKNLSDAKIDAKFRVAAMLSLSTDLANIHDKSVIHCDIKESNIRFDPKTNKLTFIDFGLAHDGKTYDLTSKGTINYVAPEILKPQGLIGHTDKSDVWSEGFVMLRTLTGEKGEWFKDNVTKTEMVEIRKNYIESLFAKLDKTDLKISQEQKAELKVVLRQMLNDDPRNRPTAEEVENKLHNAVTSVKELKGKELEDVLKDAAARTTNSTTTATNVTMETKHSSVGGFRSMPGKAAALAKDAADHFSETVSKVSDRLSARKVDKPEVVQSPEVSPSYRAK